MIDISSQPDIKISNATPSIGALYNKYVYFLKNTEAYKSKIYDFSLLTYVAETYHNRIFPINELYSISNFKNINMFLIHPHYEIDRSTKIRTFKNDLSGYAYYGDNAEENIYQYLTENYQFKRFVSSAASRTSYYYDDVENPKTDDRIKVNTDKGSVKLS